MIEQKSIAELFKKQAEIGISKILAHRSHWLEEMKMGQVVTLVMDSLP